MNGNTFERPITISATNRDALERELDHAVQLVREKAMTEGLHGILVTHEAPGRSTVALHGEVPYGLTREKRAW